MNATRTQTNRSPRPRPAPRPASTRDEPPDARILRRWITHQAVLYNDLLRTIASAPNAPQGRG